MPQVAFQKQQISTNKNIRQSIVPPPNFSAFLSCSSQILPCSTPKALLQVTPPKRMWRPRRISWRPCVQAGIRCQRWTWMACVCALGFKRIRQVVMRLVVSCQVTLLKTRCFVCALFSVWLRHMFLLDMRKSQEFILDTTLKKACMGNWFCLGTQLIECLIETLFWFRSRNMKSGKILSCFTGERLRNSCWETSICFLLCQVSCFKWMCSHHSNAMGHFTSI